MSRDATPILNSFADACKREGLSTYCRPVGTDSYPSVVISDLNNENAGPIAAMLREGHKSNSVSLGIPAALWTVIHRINHGADWQYAKGKSWPACLNSN